MTEHNNTTLRHLLLTFPGLEVDHDGREVVDELVKGTIHSLQQQRGQSAILLLQEVLDRISELVGLSYEPGEIHASLDRLGASDFLRFTSPSHDSFVADSESAQAVASTLTARLARDGRVFEKWLDNLRAAHALTEDELSTLAERFNAFLADVVHFHAAEAAGFLYSADDDGHDRFFAQLDSHLPAATDALDDHLAAIAETAFREFFGGDDPDFRDYVADRLQVAFYYHLLSIDPAGSELVRDNFTDKILYLDTNVIYRLVGLHGPAFAYSAIAVANVSRELGITLRVTRETINEYLRSLRAEVRRGRAFPVVRETYTRVLADSRHGQGSVMQTYYKLKASGRVRDLREFEQRYASITTLLREWDVTVDECTLEDADRDSDEFRDLFARLNDWHYQEKPIKAIEHDVFLARTIRRRRGEIDESMADVKFWLLTYDRRLARFAVSQATADHQSFCVMADDWLQITGPFLPRTEDYRNAFSALLDNPALHPAAGTVPFEHMVEAAHRLERYQELPMPVVASVMAGGEFIRKLRETDSEEAEREIVEMAISEAAGRVVEERDELVTEVENLRDRVTGLEEGLRVSKAGFGRQAGAKAAAEEEARRLREALAEEKRQSRQGRQELEARVADTKRERDDARRISMRRERRGKWVIFAVTAGFVLWEVIGWAFGEWRELSGVRRAVVVGSTIMVLAGLLTIPLGVRGWKIFLGCAAVLGVIGWAYQWWMG